LPTSHLGFDSQKIDLTKTIKIVDCWKITGYGMLADIQNLHGGLPTGTMLKSQTSGLTWQILSRMFGSLSDDNETTRFSNETESLMTMSFKTADDRVKAKESIAKKNRNSIFQYRIQAIGHIEKPNLGETLSIE